jgi:hypothetical protein
MIGGDSKGRKQNRDSLGHSVRIIDWHASINQVELTVQPKDHSNRLVPGRLIYCRSMMDRIDLIEMLRKTA